MDGTGRKMRSMKKMVRAAGLNWRPPASRQVARCSDTIRAPPNHAARLS